MLYNSYMSTNTVTKIQPGPVSRGFKATSVQLPPDLLEWAKHQPEGLSGLVRLLLSQERPRREKSLASAP